MKTDEIHKNKTESQNATNLSKRAEELMVESEEQIRAFLENIQEAYFEVDLDGKFTMLNDSVCQVLGYSKEELIGIDCKNFTDKDDVEKFLQVYREVNKTEKPIKHFDWHIIRKDSSKRYIEGSVSLRKDLSGKSIGFRVIANDFTERKNAEDALRMSEKYFKEITENSSDIIIITDKNGDVKYCSRSIERFAGYKPEDLIGKNGFTFIHPDDMERAFNDYSNAIMEPNTAIPNGFRIVHKDGSERYFEGLGKNLLDNPDIAGFIMNVRDVTERKKAEELLKKSEEQYRLLADNITEHIWLRDINTLKVIYISPSVEKMYGYPVDEIRNLPLKKLLTEESFQKMIDSFITEMPKALATLPPSVHKYSFETQAYHKDGHLLWMDHTLSFLRDENEKLAFLLGETRDITKRKLVEHDLQHTLESLRKAFGTTINVMVSAIEMRDPYTAGHQIRSADLARAIATDMGLPAEKIDGIRLAGSIHDIGKLSIASEILSKPTKLKKIEFDMIKEHSRVGYDMLKDIESPWPLAEAVYQHHERMNGTGYPRNLKGDEIIMEARILAVADVVEAMASHRPYRASLGIEAALEEIEKNKGILYDDTVADVCLRLFREKGYQLK